jgi:hypothetical protein
MNDKLTAQAQYITTLDATLTDVNGRKLTEVGNTTGQLVKTEINNATGQIQAYSLYSNVNQIDINGIRYVDGFGMYSGLVKPDPNDSSKNYIYDSEFWVSADKFMIYDKASLSDPNNIVYEDTVVYNPKTQQNETKKLIKEIKNAKPVFGVNSVTKEVEINGNLVVNGTITADKIKENELSDMLYVEGQYLIYLTITLNNPSRVIIQPYASMFAPIDEAMVYLNRDNAPWGDPFFRMSISNAISFTRPLVYNLEAGTHSWGFHEPQSCCILQMTAVVLKR